jgi:hypothetical protein
MCITEHWVAFAKQLLPWKSKNYYIFGVSVCIALFIQQANCMRRIILSSVAHYLINCMKHVLIFSATLPEIFLILITIKRDIIINSERYSCKVPVILFWF